MKRWLVRICVFLLLGAIVNVAVAWGLVHSTSQLRSHPVFAWTSDDHPSPIHESDRQMLSELQWEQVPVAGRTVAVKLHLSVRLATGICIRTITEEEKWRTASAGGGNNRTALLIASAGWPLLSLEGLRFDASSPTARTSGQSVWEYRAAIPRRDVRIGLRGNDLFPLLPIWPGFAINTVFYAFVLWLLFAGPFVLRRWRRIRRGLCPKCAYDLRGTPEGATCPECGPGG